MQTSNARPTDRRNTEVPAANRGHRSSRTTRFSATPQDRFLTTEHRRSRFIRKSAEVTESPLYHQIGRFPALRSIPRFSSESPIATPGFGQLTAVAGSD